jgi:Calcineurin-like phosphoesterase/Bacterial Ig domain/Purple acid Phosphatase, N-terminal domain
MQPLIKPSPAPIIVKMRRHTFRPAFRILRSSITALAGLAGGLVFGLLPAQCSLRSGPMLQGGTATNVYVLAECTVNASSPMTVNYGTSAAYGSSATTAIANTTSLPSYVHVIKLTGLQPNTLYHYQLVGQGTTSPDYTFRTVVTPGTPFRFAWACDYRNGTAVHGQLARGILSSNNVPSPPLFSLSAGDYAGDNTYTSWTNQWLVPDELTLQKYMVSYLSPGNHDTWTSAVQMKSFDQPPDSTGANGYYSFDCGDLHVTMANYQYTYSSGSAQYNWIQQDVQASLKPWKIFGTHAPAYTYGGSGTHTGDSGFQTITSNLLEPNGVKAFLAGHNHFYQRNLVNGLHHITCGAAGAPLYSVSSGSGTVVSVSDNCYLVADVSPTNLHIVAYNNAGTVLDNFTLVKPPAPVNLAATPGVGQVALTWNAVAGATNYTVWYGTTSGGPYPTKKNSTVASTTVTSLANGTNYYFVVTATDPNGPSAISAQVSAIPTNPAPVVALSSPTNGTAFAAPATITLAAVVTTNGNTINKVQFYSNTTNLIGEDAIPPYAFVWSGVAAGTYSVLARVVYNGSNAADSTAASVTVTNLPPVISSFGTLSNGSFSLGGIGAASQTYILLTASNLASPMAWTPIATNAAGTNGAFSFSDLEATNYQQRFYRIRTP